MADKENNIEMPKMKGATDQKIDAIKQLIFGENIQEYDEEFKQIRKNILDAKTELANKLAETSKELKNMIETLRENHDKKIEDLRGQMLDEVRNLDHKKLDRNLLGDLLQEIGGKIKE
ncbi:hypothetical protein [Flexithrix dorotheae]|uniref:hypothetical protein n=1 Tax=Flexithrix dorotheae TaxID=70993 RepID=UPI00035C175C|nr:hypothetical protein [Flexithrix dorotheae]